MSFKSGYGTNRIPYKVTCCLRIFVICVIIINLSVMYVNIISVHYTQLQYNTKDKIITKLYL